jgi:hypothetical protein
LRRQKEIKSHEISLVAVPVNPHAQITSVKSLDDVLPLLRGLRAATAPDVIAMLKSIDDELRRLLAGAGRDSDGERAEALAALRELDAKLKAVLR